MLRRNFSWSLGGHVVYMACQWAVLLVIIRLGNPTQVGQFALGLAVTAPAMLCANLGLRQIQATDAKGEYAFGEYWGLRLITTLLALVALGGVTALSGYSKDTAVVVLVVALAKAIEALSDAAYGLLQHRHRMDLVAKSLVMRGSCSVPVVGIGMYAGGGVAWGILAMAVAWCLLLLMYDLPNVKRQLVEEQNSISSVRRSCLNAIRPSLDRRRLMALTMMAAPLGLVAMLNSINTNIPRYVIELHLGEGALGVFAALASLITCGHLIGSALQQSASPVAARHLSEGNVPAFVRLLWKMIGLCLIVGVLGILLAGVMGREIVDLLFGSEYAGSHGVLLLLMVAAAFLYLNWPFDTALIVLRRFHAHLTITIVQMVIVLVVSATWIPDRGLSGAAAAIMAGCIGAAVLKGLVLWRALGRLECSDAGRPTDRSAFVFQQ